MRLGIAAGTAAMLLTLGAGAAAQPADASAPTDGTSPAAPPEGAPADPDPALGPDAPAPSEDHVPATSLPRPTAAPAPPAMGDDGKVPDPYVPFAADTLAGQFQLGIGGLMSVPFGELSRGVDAFPQIDVGFGPAVDLGIGVSRHVVVGVYGESAFHGAASACTDCSSTSFGAGAFVRYHLVQGLRFDPWISYGVGYRGLMTRQAGAAGFDYAGVEWLRVQFGGDWYAFRQFGFGPFVELGAASFLNAPSGDSAGGVNWRFQLGLRLLIDLPGR